MTLNQQDIIHFLRTAYFGNIDDAYSAASSRAFRDFCRTIRSHNYKDASDETKDEARNRVTSYIKNKIQELRDKEQLDQDGFNDWHHTVCQGIIEAFSICTLNYGQAQKWLNMMFKYLCVLDESLWNDEFFKYLHVPFDNIIIDIAVESGFINRPEKRWSQWNEDEYNLYQANLIASIRNNKGRNYPPLLWEFRNWKAEDSLTV